MTPLRTKQARRESSRDVERKSPRIPVPMTGAATAALAALVRATNETNRSAIIREAIEQRADREAPGWRG